MDYDKEALSDLVKGYAPDKSVVREYEDFEQAHEAIEYVSVLLRLIDLNHPDPIAFRRCLSFFARGTMFLMANFSKQEIRALTPLSKETISAFQEQVEQWYRENFVCDVCGSKRYREPQPYDEGIAFSNSRLCADCVRKKSLGLSND